VSRRRITFARFTLEWLTGARIARRQGGNGPLIDAVQLTRLGRSSPEAASRGSRLVRISSARAAEDLMLVENFR
jgi:hypothetical protein